jgi:hypothetical protein
MPAVQCGFWVAKTYRSAAGRAWWDDNFSQLDLLRGSQSGGGIIYQNSDAELFSVKVDVVDGRPGLHLRVFNDFDDLLERQRKFQEQRMSVKRHRIDFDPYLSPWTDPDYAALTRLPFSNRRIDRISKRLASGHSVSGILKPSTIPDRDGYIRYMVEITIDSTGNLRWPEE